MRDLQDQFRDLDALDAPDQWASIEARAMVEDAATGRAGRLYTPPWEAALAAALAVLLLIGGAAWLFGGFRSDAVDQPPVSSPTQPGTTSPPVVPESLVPGPWTAHVLPGSFPEVTAVGQSDTWFVTSGMTFTQGEVWARPQIWLSRNGSQWIEAGGPSVFAEGQSAIGAMANGSGIVVLGNDWRQGGNVVWYSAEGLGWEQVAVDEEALEAALVTDGLALSSGTFILYGVPPRCSVETGNCVPEDAPRILVSADGLSWEMLATPITFSAITEASGELLGVGESLGAPTTWISTDEGRTWSQHGPDRAPQDGRSVYVWTLDATPFGLLASGLDGDGRPTIWVSEDNQVFDAVFTLPEGAEVHDFASGGGWVIAVGSIEAPTSPNPRPLLVASRDGREWQTVQLEGSYRGGAALSGIAYRNSAFVAAGNHAYSPENAGIPLILRWETADDS